MKYFDNKYFQDEIKLQIKELGLWWKRVVSNFPIKHFIV
jgi:hypothetical protein